MRRTPPDILITTPESLYLMLTSQAREMLTRRRGGDRRRDPRGRGDQARRAPGADARAPRGAPGRRPRPAAHRPVGDAEPARGGRPLPGRPAAHVHGSSTPACASRSTSRSRCRSSRWSSPSRAPATSIRSIRSPGGEATRRSIWPAIYPELLELVREHRSTIVFVNNRRGAERLALRLNELPTPTAEDASRRDRPRPPRLARARGAHGRRGACSRPASCRASWRRRRSSSASTWAPSTSCSRSSRRSRSRAACSASAAPATTSATRQQGPHLPEVPRRPARVRGRRAADARGRDRADRRAAQRARRARPADRRDRRLGGRRRDGLGRRPATRSSRAPTPTPSCRASCSRTCSTCSTAATRRRSSASCARASCGTASPGTIRARKGARQLAVTNAGTIPDRGLFAVTLPDGRRVGELDEEMVYEARPGQTFLLGASTWRIEEIGRDRVIVTPAPGAPGRGAVLEGRRRRAPEGARRGDRRVLRAGRVDQTAETLERDYDLDELAARNLLDFLREQQDATRVIPSDRTIVVERFRDEIGDWRLCVLSPVRRPRARRLGPGAERAASATSSASSPTRSGPTTGSSSTSPTPTSRPAPTSCCSSPTRSRTASSPSWARSALFGARFRENAGRALLIPRAYPGKRTPLWQQRLKSQSLLEVAKRYGRLPDHPRDLPRVPARRARPARACTELLTQLHRRELVARRGRDADRLAVRVARCCSTTSRRTCTRATRPTPSGARRRCRSTATCCASCSARRSCAS